MFLLLFEPQGSCYAYCHSDSKSLNDFINAKWNSIFSTKHQAWWSFASHGSELQPKHGDKTT